MAVLANTIGNSEASLAVPRKSEWVKRQVGLTIENIIKNSWMQKGKSKSSFYRLHQESRLTS